MENVLNRQNHRLGVTLDKIENAFINVASIVIAVAGITIALSPLLVLL